MTPKVLLPFLIGLTAFAGPLVGQEVRIPKTDAQEKAEKAEVAEDVEILRRFLNRSVGLEFPDGNKRRTPGLSTFDGMTVTMTDPAAPRLEPAGTPASPAWMQLPRVLPQFDGIHLKGHGVAFTLRLSSFDQVMTQSPHKEFGLEVTCQHCHISGDVAKFDLKPPARPEAKPLTEWERARNDLRGVPPAKSEPVPGDATVGSMCTPGMLTESVTKVLALYGRNVRHLPADEGVTVVITYDGVTGPADDRTAGTLADPHLWSPPATPFGLTADESKQIVLGDLHLKQGKYDEAAKAYQAALARYPAAVNRVAVPKELKPAEAEAALKELHKNVTAAYRSLAQAYIGVGNLDEAKRALNLAQQLKVEPAGGGKKSAPPVPAKIILTVKKAHLDAAEKLSPAEFRKVVGVELVGMSAAKK